MTIDDLRPGLRHSATIAVTEALAVPASGRHLVAVLDKNAPHVK